MTTGQGREMATYETPGQLETIRELEDSFAIAVRQRELLADYITKRMHPGKHFYKVADGQKPSLTKEGAELICLPHGYRPAYFKLGGPDQPPEDDTPYQITILCRLMKPNGFGGEGIGSASSHITRRDGPRVVRMRDVGLRHNATLKMAQKSAYIAATLNATAASEFFTQDMEDVEVGPKNESVKPTGATGSQPQEGALVLYCPVHTKVVLVHRQGKSKAGKPYDGYFCPTNNCKTVVWTSTLEHKETGEITPAAIAKAAAEVAEIAALAIKMEDSTAGTTEALETPRLIPDGSKGTVGADTETPATDSQTRYIVQLATERKMPIQTILDRFQVRTLKHLTVAEANNLIDELKGKGGT